MYKCYHNILSRSISLSDSVHQPVCISFSSPQSLISSPLYPSSPALYPFLFPPLLQLYVVLEMKFKLGINPTVQKQSYETLL